MENAIITLLYDLCRLCLNKPGIHDIFETDILVHDILSSTGIRKISCDDKLPKAICTHCMYKIEAAKDLKEYATKNDMYMRSLLSNESNMRYEVARPRIKPRKKYMRSCTEKNEKCPKLKSKDRNKEIIHTNSSTQTTSWPRISVRSLEDINSGRPSIVEKSSEKENTAHKTLKESTSPPDTPSDKKSPHNPDNKCDLCSKAFLTSKKLYLHRRSHSKKLHCPLDACGKKFATKGDLQKHIRSHTGEKPYQCDLCDKRFTQKVTLKFHKDAIHEAKMDVTK